MRTVIRLRLEAGGSTLETCHAQAATTQFGAPQLPDMHGSLLTTAALHTYYQHLRSILQLCSRHFSVRNTVELFIHCKPCNVLSFSRTVLWSFQDSASNQPAIISSCSRNRQRSRWSNRGLLESNHSTGLFTQPLQCMLRI